MRRPPPGVILPVTEPSHAVFLSYASQDAEAAQKICEALRAAGIEVFLDQSELRGGDVWDQKIRREIHDCALFIPVISANTASRHEGYFRLEWDLADQRTHMIARSRVFVVPVCLDATHRGSRGRSRVVSAGAVDAPAQRGHTRGLRRTCTASAVRGAVTGADRDSVGRASRADCTFDPKARPGTLAVKGGAPRNDCGARRRTRLLRRKPTSCFRSVVQRLERHRRLRLRALQPPPSTRRRTRSRCCRS